MKRTGKTGLATGLAVLGALSLSACDLEVLNPGSILDEDLTTRDLMPILVSGVSAEFNDIGDFYAFDIARLTDDLSGTGSYFSTGQYRRGVFDNENSEGHWEQAHEAAWAAGVAWDRLQSVLEAEANSFDGSSRLFLLMGLAHRMLGENFCDMVYNIGPLQPRTAAFDSAIVALNQSVTIGQAAGATKFVTAAHGGIAQANVGLGNWSAATQAASMVPTDFVHNAIYHLTANSNGIWNESWGRAEVGVWATPVQRLFEGDPRAPFTICGAWDDPSGPSWGEVTPTGACTGQGSGAHQGADGLTAHYRQDKYNEAGSDVPIVTGTEMRLIEAEAALLGGDLATFTAKVNEVRAHYGAEPIEQPASAGALEFPNAQDDAWSILDRERYLTLWMEGRRLFDLDRWNHPFLQGGTLIGPGAEPRVSCMPIPEIECTLNPEIENSSVCT
jgi:hypothetical protein